MDATGKRYIYLKHKVSDMVRFYTSIGLRSAEPIPEEEYAKARASIPMWCLDALVCITTTKGQKAVLLLVRSSNNDADGPFRNEPWVAGGKWDMVTPWEQFVRRKVSVELFRGRPMNLDVSGPIGNQLFATGWGKGTDGPFGEQGVTMQYCYQIEVKTPVDPEELTPDDLHSGVVTIAKGDNMNQLHPYIKDVIEMSGWLD